MRVLSGFPAGSFVVAPQLGEDASASPKAPVVNRHDTPLRLPWNLGNPTLRPRQVPVRESAQFFNAIARLTSPEE